MKKQYLFWRIFLILLVFALITMSSKAHAAMMVTKGNASRVFEALVSLTTGVSVTFETRNCSAGSDPVLHVLRTDGSQLAVDDNSGGGTLSRLTVAPSTSGYYILVLRARGNSSGGRCDIYRDGSLKYIGQSFGGWIVLLDNIRSGEQIETVRLPNGAGPTHALYILKSDGLGIGARAYNNGTAGAARYTAGSNLGARNVVVAARDTFGSNVQLIRNDASLFSHDPDNDGLGTELEAALGTCSYLSGVAIGPDGKSFDCSLATDPRDTDGDGISDRWEALGRRDMQPHQPLALWGANPRHKDLFVEVDFMLRMPGEIAQKLTPAKTREFTRYYQDEIGAASNLQKAYRAAILRNPDGLSGVKVHMDTGVPPEIPSDATLYGDWGGYTAVPPVQNPDGTYAGQYYGTAWQTNMTPARRGIFRYAIPYASGGGQVGINSFAFTGPINDSWTLTHESGHAMGISHSGITEEFVVNCKPNYPSLMNYAFNDGSVGFSDGLGTPTLNNWSLKEWESVSPTNTAFLNTLENKFKYWVDRDYGHVDWNRDGVFAPDGTYVRTYANYVPYSGAGCEYTGYNQTALPNATSIKSPAIARLGNRLYIFYSEYGLTGEGLLNYNYSTSSWNCPVPSKTIPCGTWGLVTHMSADASRGVDVAYVPPDNILSSGMLIVVTVDSFGQIWDRRLYLNSLGEEVWTSPVRIPGLSRGEPSLAYLNGRVYLAYKYPTGEIHFNQTSDCVTKGDRLGCSYSWLGEEIAYTSEGAKILSASYSSPAIGRAYLPWKPGIPGLYGAFADINGMLDIYWFNTSTRRWEKTDVLEARPGPVEGRPAMAWVPYSSGSSTPYPGRFYLIYINYDGDTSKSFTDKNRLVSMMISYVKVTTLPDGTLYKTEKVGLQSPFDNVWAYAFGVDLLYEPGIDTNLRAILSYAVNKPESWKKLWFRPNADGINNYVYPNANDWATIRIGLCRNVANPGGFVSNPINCP